MAEIVRMPKMSDTMTEGVVAKWHKKVGDTIKSGDLVAEIETDKATMEFESYQSGTLLYIGVPEGKAGAINSVLAIIGAPGEDYKALLEAEEKNKAAEQSEAAKKEEKPAPKTESKPTPKAEPKPEVKTVSSPAQSQSDSRLKVSPLARSLAEQKGIDLSKIKGSGDNGRIIKRDIDWFKPGSYVAGGMMTTALTHESFEEQPV